MTSEKNKERDVKKANRRFYDAVAHNYEEIDGRRSPELEVWLHKKLTTIRALASGGSLLDIGTGGGLVTRCAKGLFPLSIGLDLSPRILAANRISSSFGVAGDGDRLPFADHSFDVVTCFAALHHLSRFEDLVSEVHRVLHPGGIFYSDHDMDKLFATRFRLPLLLYRRYHNSGAKPWHLCKGITQELYDLTECQKQGLDSGALVRLFEAQGFSVEAKFHWFGLTPPLSKLFGQRHLNHGWAPLISLVATRGTL